VDNKREDTNAEDIRAYIGILIYMGLVDLQELEDYFEGDFCVCPIVRQAMTLQQFKKFIWIAQKKFQKLLRQLAPLTFLIRVQAFPSQLHGELPHAQIFMNVGLNPLT